MGVLSPRLGVDLIAAKCPYHCPGTDAERANWRLIGNGVGVHRPDLDEDIGIEGLVLGKRLREGGVSLAGWLAKYYGTSPEFWLNLQMRWDVTFAQQARRWRSLSRWLSATDWQRRRRPLARSG